MDKKRKSACKATKDAKKASLENQPTISNFFEKKGTITKVSTSLNEQKSPLKRKTEFQNDNDEQKVGTKLRKTSYTSIQEHKKEMLLTNGNCTKLKMQKEKVELFEHHDLFSETDFSFESTDEVHLEESCMKNKSLNASSGIFSDENSIKKSDSNFSCSSHTKSYTKIDENSFTENTSFENNSTNDVLKVSSVFKESKKVTEIEVEDFEVTKNHAKENGMSEKNKNHNDLEMDDFFDDDDDWSGDLKVELDLSSYKRCQCINIERHPREILLTVREVDSKREGEVRCKEFWNEIKIKLNQICTIKAKKEADQWIIDNKYGFLIVDPDTLLAGTTITAGLFCARRSILNDMFNGLQTLPHYEPDTLALITGILSHEILQEALQSKTYTLRGITNIYQKKIKSQHFLNSMYANNLTLAECQRNTFPYVKHIFDFIQMYVSGPDFEKEKREFCVEKVRDIEENIWLPKLGLKGKIDITADVTIHSKRKMLPIEIKTGKPTFSVEHKGQVILYALMMNLTGRKCDSGYLVYLKDNLTKEVQATHQEIRDLLLLRNNLAYYFGNKLRNSNDKDDKELSKYFIELPEPINHHVCERCPVNTLCCIYLSENEKASMAETHYLKTLSDNILKRLSTAHIDYVLKWCTLLQLEQRSETLAYPQNNVWTLDPKTREKQGTCISNLKISSRVVEKEEIFFHVFTRLNDSNAVDFNMLEFSEDEYVIISTNNRVNVESGRVSTVDPNSITVKLKKNIQTLFPFDVFHIDKYSSSNLTGYNNYGNLGGLLDDDENCARLRSIIIDRIPAKFSNELTPSISHIVSDCTKSLNECQRKAVIKALSMDNYMLIKGMPGTGKTQTLVALIQLLIKLGKSVLVTAHTNSAVDNILLKLLKRNVDFLRLGSSSKIPAVLHNKCESRVTANCTSPEDIENIFCNKNIVGVTCYSANHPLLAKKKFDICIVDESTQVLQPTIIRPLYSASKFILVGDPEQLPPIAKSDEARKLGFNESLFERLNIDNNAITLRAQYRMNSRIMDVANKLTYNDTLIAGNDLIANATMRIKDHSVIQSSEKWVQNVLSTELEDSAIVIDTTPTWTMKIDDHVEYETDKDKNIDFCTNVWELAIITRIIDILLKTGINIYEIGVIAPYRAQVAFLKKNIHSSVEINTVDQYQGRDKEIIIYSCTKSTDLSWKIKEFDILGDHSRLTVAVTRAKHKLIVIGDKACLDRFPPFNKLFKSINSEHVITIKNGENDFCWKDLMKMIKM